MTKKLSLSTKKRRVQAFLNSISYENATFILESVILDDMSLLPKAKRLANSFLSSVDVDEVATDVINTLESIEPEDIWDLSGNTRDGYISPSEAAYEILETSIEPFFQKLKEYISLSLWETGASYCIGVLKGIHFFSIDSKTSAMNELQDSPGFIFHEVLDTWLSNCSDVDVNVVVKDAVNSNFLEY